MIATRDETERRSHAAALGAAGWLGLAAAPTFAVMALLTYVLRRRRGHDVLGRAWCVAAERNGPNVPSDERLPLCAVAETDLRSIPLMTRSGASACWTSPTTIE